MEGFFKRLPAAAEAAPLTLTVPVRALHPPGQSTFRDMQVQKCHTLLAMRLGDVYAWPHSTGTIATSAAR